MSDFGEQPQPYDSSEQDFSGEMTYTGPAPVSGMAVAGLVSSIVICCPVISPLLGLILSGIGLSQTSGGQRRGRGLAIAGILVSLLVGVPSTIWSITWTMNIFLDASMVMQKLTFLDSSNIDETVDTLYAMGSDEFTSAVTKEQLKTWLKTKFDDYGGLQSIVLNPGDEPKPQGDRVVFPFQAKFPEKTVPMEVEFTIVMSSGHWYLENVIFDGEPLVSVSDDEPVQPDADAETDMDTASDGDAGEG